MSTTRRLTLPLMIFLLLVLHTPGEGDQRSEPAQDAAAFLGALDIRIHPAGEAMMPPGELLIIDPKGRKTGVDTRTNQTFLEIPRSSYAREGIGDASTGAPGPETRVLDIRNPVDGDYALLVTGDGSDPYHLEIRGYDRDMHPSDVVFKEVRIHPGAEHRYQIKYSNRKGSRIEASRVRA